MDIPKFDFPEIPAIAKGEVLPESFRRVEMIEKEKKAAERKACLYFWGGIVCNIFCLIAGWLLGKYC